MKKKKSWMLVLTYVISIFLLQACDFNLGQSGSSGSDTSLEGSWEITEAKNPDGSEYKGEVTIENLKDNVYKVTWNVGNTTYDGVAFQEGNDLYVG